MPRRANITTTTRRRKGSHSPRQKVQGNSSVLKAKDIEEPQPIRLDKNEIDVPDLEATSLVLTLNQEDDQGLNQNEVLLLDALKALTIGSDAPYPEGASAGA